MHSASNMPWQCAAHCRLRGHSVAVAVATRRSLAAAGSVLSARQGRIDPGGEATLAT